MESTAATNDQVSEFEAIAELLGGRAAVGRRPLQSAIDVHEAVMLGLKPRSVDRLMGEFRLQRVDIERVLGVSSRTLQRWQKQPKLPPHESDLLWRLASVLHRATHVLGSREKAASWIHSPNRALGGRAPLSLLGSEAGFSEVEDVLGRIEHGVWS